MAKRRSSRKKSTAARPRRAKPRPKPRANVAEALAREIVAAWRRGESLDLDDNLASLVDTAKQLPARSRQALYRAVNRIVRARAVRNRLAESELSALVVRAIELETIVEVAAGDGSALAAFIGE
jgi:hypothetical protein